MEQQGKRIKDYTEIEKDTVCFWFDEERKWWCIYIPSCGIGNLSAHTVKENDDKTITVTPSILMTGHKDGLSTKVHGYLTNGIWKEC